MKLVGDKYRMARRNQTKNKQRREISKIILKLLSSMQILDRKMTTLVEHWEFGVVAKILATSL